MSVPWKTISSRVRPSNWTGMAWAVLVLVLLTTGGTIFVGMKLYAVTDYPVQFNPK